MLKLKLHCRSPDIEDPNDRVEVAFRRLDSDGDGYLHLEDFVQLGWPLVRAEVGQDQLQRIFHGCDQTGDGRVSLQVTRTAVNETSRSFTITAPTSTYKRFHI